MFTTKPPPQHKRRPWLSWLTVRSLVVVFVDRARPCLEYSTSADLQVSTQPDSPDKESADSLSACTARQCHTVCGDKFYIYSCRRVCAYRQSSRQLRQCITIVSALVRQCSPSGSHRNVWWAARRCPTLRSCMHALHHFVLAGK